MKAVIYCICGYPNFIYFNKDTSEKIKYYTKNYKENHSIKLNPLILDEEVACSKCKHKGNAILGHKSWSCGIKGPGNKRERKTVLFTF